MTFETPLQRVVTRPAGLRTAVFAVLLLGVAGLLVWQPWSPRSGGRPAIGGEASSPRSSPRAHPSASPVPSATPGGDVVALRRPSGRLPAARGPFPTSPPGFAVAPAADDFDARWSAVGISELLEGRYRITQLPLFPTTGFVEGRSTAETCQLGRERFPYVAILPADRLRFLGVVTPEARRGALVDLGWIDASEAPAYEVPVAATGGAASPVHLFALADRALWPAGAYRFLVFTTYGAPRYLYACLR